MRGNRFYILIILAIALIGQHIVSSCSDVKEVTADSDLVPLKLAAALDHNSYTRAGTDIQDSTFINGMKTSVYFTPSQLGNPRIYTADGSETPDGALYLRPDVPVYYPAGDATVSAYALYPDTVPNTTGVFTVRYDQREDYAYILSDLMHASFSNQVKTDKAVVLRFSHKMAKFILNIKCEDDLVFENIRLYANRAIGFTPSTGALGALSDKGYIEVDSCGACLIPPQAITTSDNFIQVKTTKGTAYFNISKNFESGIEYTINITVGQQSLEHTTTIVPWSADRGSKSVVLMSTTGMRMSSIASMTYTGNELTPVPEKVYYGNTELTSADYTLQYANNVHVGTGSVIAVGKGTYNGRAAVQSFTINQATGSVSYSQHTVSPYFVKGQYVNNPVTIVGNGTMTYASSDTTVAKVNAMGEVVQNGVGTTTITASMADDKDYTGDQDSYTLNVLPTPITESMVNWVITPATFSYTGEAIKPAVTVMNGNATLKENTDYTLSYANNTNVTSNATVTITGSGNFGGTVTKTFSITQANNPMIMTNSDATILEGATLVREAHVDFGVVTYTSTNSSVAPVSNTGVVTGLSAGTAKITAKVDETTNYKGATLSYNVTVNARQSFIFNFTYTGSEETWTCPLAGTWKLEVAGAQGGSYNGGWNPVSGGTGGYSTGTVNLAKDEVLYINVGGQGGTPTSRNGGAGGYNGGGNGGNSNSNWFYGAGGGGGATHIAKVSGLLSTLSSQKSKILLVAGGGGGSSYGLRGGNGGGEFGGSARAGNVDLFGGDQSSGYAFGQGANGVNGSWGASAGGGGGLWGGRASTDSRASGSGSGGSGYIGGVSSGNTRGGAQKGNGYVKITLVSGN